MKEDNENLEENKIEEKEEIVVEDEKETKVEEETVKPEEEKIEEETKNEEIKAEVKSQEVKEDPKDLEEKKKSFKKPIIIITTLIIIALFVSTIFAILNIDNINIINGVYIEKTNVSNISKEEANKLISNKIENIENVELNCEEYKTTTKLEEFGITIDAKDALDKASQLGKTNNIVLDNYCILKTNLLKTKFDLNINIDENKFNEMSKNIQAEIPGAVKQYSYEINKDKLKITKGTEGKSVDSEKLKEKVLKNIIDQFNGESGSIEIPTKEVEPDEIDIEKIYNEIYSEPKDAYIVDSPFELHKEQKGVDFAITIEEAKKMLEEDKKTYTIPLKITNPKVKVENLGEKLFKQTLSKYTTIYDAGNYSRATNIAIAAKTLNGTILLPGESFSYNGTLGPRTASKGYQKAPAYFGGKVVQEYGGGICQVSSTLYNAVLYANLEIVERHNHGYAVSYVPISRDATVSYGGSDFKFKNNRKYPVKIVASARNGVVSISIKGIKETKEYEVVLTSTVLSTIPNKTVYEKTNTLEEGKQRVIQTGHGGQKGIAYKILKYNGKTVSKTVLSKDTYNAMTRIVQVGTKKKVQTTQTTTKPTSAPVVQPTPKPTPTPEPTANIVNNTVQ